MPKRGDIKKIMTIGSGPIVVEQAAEFDYTGCQACTLLREEGYEAILINSNPVTTTMDTVIVDRAYVEPLTLEFASCVIYKERPDAILGSLGGQTGLNLVVRLAESGILDEYHVEILGTALDAIEKAEDRDKFRELMREIGEPIPESVIVHTIEGAVAFACENGYPVVVHPVFTLGGTGGGFVHSEEGLRVICDNGLRISPVRQCLIEQSIAGYKEIKYEAVRDNADNAIVICSMENVDPVGVHTGDSIVVAPTQALTGRECGIMHASALRIIRALKIRGGCNVQLALDPNSSNYYIIEVNPRASRSSVLASKATGYPIAELAAKMTVGLTLDEIINPVTTTSYACVEPCIDYVVTKLPRFASDKFPKADRTLGTQMKATGEVMSIGRTFGEAILKTVRSLEMKTDHLEQKGINAMNEDALWKKLAQRDDERIYVITALLRKGADIEDIFAVTKMDRYFLNRFKNIVAQEIVIRQHLMDLNVLQASKKMGFADSWIARSWNVEGAALYDTRKQNDIMPVYKNVNTCVGEYISHTPYLYSTYEHENESVYSDNRKIIVLGSGPIRIGQGVEFDYATVHRVKTIRKRGYEAIVINNNPETIPTDCSISGKLYFESLMIKDVMHVIDLEQPLGVVVQFGGQTAINLVDKLIARGVKILGTSLEDIDRAEDRHEFEGMLHKLDIPQPQGETAVEVEEAVKIANRIGYSVLAHPSYVLGGRAMGIVYDDDDLRVYMATAVKEISHDVPILVDKYIIGKEMEVDAICDGEYVYILGIMKHIERAGVHSGDSISVYPALTTSQKVKDTIIDYATRIGKGFHFIGLYNIQFIVETDKESGEERAYVLGVNPRSSRTVPFLSKVTNVGMSYMATRCVLGDSLKDQGYEEGVHPEGERVFVKALVFSFAKLRSVDTILGPEMKSTGEALGGDIALEKALYKVLLASGVKIPLHGNVPTTVADNDKQEGLKIAKRFSAIGYGIYATKGTAQYLSSNGIYVKTVDKVKEETDNNVIDVIRKGRVNYVVNTMSISSEVNRDGFEIRRAAAENNINCFTSLDTANAVLRVLESQTSTTISMSELER